MSDIDEEEKDVGELKSLKSAADTLFHRLDECSIPDIDCASYQECIAMYLRILKLSVTFKDEVVCRLNIASCFWRLGEWKRIQSHCSTVIQSCSKEENKDTWQYEIRAHYLMLLALTKLDEQSAMVEINKHAKKLHNLVLAHRASLSTDHIYDYEQTLNYINSMPDFHKQQQNINTELRLADDFQALGCHEQAALTLAKSAIALRDTSTDTTALIQMHMQVAFIYYHLREFSKAAKSSERAHALALDASQELHAVLAEYLSAECILRSGHTESCNTSANNHFLLQQALAHLEDFVFPSNSVEKRKSYCQLAVLMLHPRRHLISTTLSVVSGTPSTEADTCDAIINILMKGYDMLGNALGKSLKWESCAEVTDRTIDSCNAILLREDLSLVCLNAIKLQRARCFCAKALMFRDNHITSMLHAASDIPMHEFKWSCKIPTTMKRSRVGMNKLSETDPSHTFHRLRFENIYEAVAILLQVAGQLYEDIDIAEAVRTYTILASYTTQIGRIQPFMLESGTHTQALAAVGIDERDMAEKAYEAWKKVALLAGRKKNSIVDELKASAEEGDSPHRIKLLHEKYYFLQQIMLSHYNAGVCAFHIMGSTDESPCVTAQHSLESAESVRAEIDKLLSSETMQKEFGWDRVTTAPGNVSEDRSLHGYYGICGDLSYHLAQAYLKLGEYVQAHESAVSACDHYLHSERLLFAAEMLRNKALNGGTMTGRNKASVSEELASLEIPMREMTAQGRLKQRQAQAAAAVSLSLLGEDRKAADALRRVAGLCLGPAEDADREVAAVKGLINRQQRIVEQEMRDSRPAPQTLPSSLTPTPLDSSSTTSPALPSSSSLSGSQAASKSNPSVQNMRWERVEPPHTYKPALDTNLIVAYFILGSFCSIAVALWWSSTAAS